jgi:hypothetical protein
MLTLVRHQVTEVIGLLPGMPWKPQDVAELRLYSEAVGRDVAPQRLCQRRIGSYRRFITSNLGSVISSMA